MTANGNVLLVDDDAAVRAVVKAALLEAEYDVCDVSSGTAALERIAESDFDVVITDIVMPTISGIELLARIKRQRPHVGVVVMSAHGTDETREVASVLGAVEHITKPFSMDVLEGATRRAVEQSRKARAGRADA